MRKNSKLAYLSGAIDGDGTLSIAIIQRKDWNGFSFQPYASLACTSREQCKWAQKHFGGNFYGYVDSRPRRLPMYHWKLYNREPLVKLVDSLVPFLFVKRPQADVLQEYFALGKTQDQKERLALAECIQWVNSNHEKFDPPQRNLCKQDMHAYIAGLLDADGEIGIRDDRGTFSGIVSISNSNRNAIDWVNSVYPGSIDTDTYEGCKDVHKWLLYANKDREKFLLGILPYLVNKKQHANILLRFLRLGSSWNVSKRRELQRKISCLQLRTHWTRQRLHAEIPALSE